MKTLVVLAHPERIESTLQRFFEEGTQHLDNITRYDIYEDLPNVNIDKVHQLLSEHDRIVFQFPLYWYSSPAGLHAWFEEVLTPSLYQDRLKGKEFGIVMSTGQKDSDFQAGSKEAFTFSELLKPFEAIANKSQMIYLSPLVVSLFAYQTEEAKQKILIDYQRYLTQENNQSLASKEKWFIERLLMLQDKEIFRENTVEVDLIVDQLETNRYHLDDLIDTLTEMEDDE